VKQTISELEQRVDDLTQQLHLAKLENASLQSQNQLYPPGTIRADPANQGTLGGPPLDLARIDNTVFPPITEQFPNGFFMGPSGSQTLYQKPGKTLTSHR
jgi:hypothetical protein